MSKRDHEITPPELALLLSVDVKVVRRWVELARAGGNSPLPATAIRINELTKRVYLDEHDPQIAEMIKHARENCAQRAERSSLADLRDP